MQKQSENECETKLAYTVRFTSLRFANLLLILSASREPQAPTARPSATPPRMSVGKCTYRYSRVKPINPASTKAGVPSLRFCRQRAKAAAKAEDVCPEGNDQPWGRATSVSISGRISQGRGRANSGFKRKWPEIM